MTSRQKLRSEETKAAIIKAAGELFSEHGFEAVTMREIAKAAGCSHTTIYIYFKDKEALLFALAAEPLQSLRSEMEASLQDSTIAPDRRLKQLSRTFIRFCLTDRKMFTLFFMTRATRVDEVDPPLEIQKAQNHLFSLLRQAIAAFLPEASDEQVLAYARICFFTLHGIIATYTNSTEPLEQLMDRLAATFDLTMDVMLAGMKQTALKEG